MKLPAPDKTLEVPPAPRAKQKPRGRVLTNWLMAYREFTNENEAPEQYHLWCGLMAIAAATGRNILMKTQYFEILTNLYIILVGPSRKVRKTTAIKIARTLLKGVDGVEFTSKVSTPEAIIDKLESIPSKTNQAATVVSYELGTLLGEQKRMGPMIDLLTDLYDGNPDFDKQTVTRGRQLIEMPWLQLVAATTPSWIGENMSKTATEGGFVARCIFVFADKRKLNNPFPEIDSGKEKIKRALINDLAHINALEGTFQFDPEAKEFYAKWYMDPSRFPAVTDPRVGGYYDQKHIHLLKVAMLLSLAESDSLVLSKRDLEAALELLAATEPGMHRSFATLGRNIYSTDLERIFNQVMDAGTGGMEHKQLLITNYHQLPRDRLDEVLATLVAMGRIKQSGTAFISR